MVEPAAASEAARRSTPVRAEARRLLIVEDQWDTANTLRTVLELIGQTVEVVAEGKAALASARTFQPDVVVCDIQLPGELSGYDVAKAIRADEATYGSPVLIAFTGFGQQADKDRAREAGFDHHVTKAGPPRELLSLIEGVARRR